jgi:hypothetical protein
MCEGLLKLEDESGAIKARHSAIEMCGEAPLPNDADSSIDFIAKCGEAYSQPAPGKGDSPRERLKATTTQAVLSANAGEALPIDVGCACADQTPDAPLCEWTHNSSDGKWETMPAAITADPGLWRGDGCIPKPCVEIGLPGLRLGYSMPEACK